MNVLICDILIRVSRVELSGVFSAVFKYATLDMTLNSTIFVEKNLPERYLQSQD